MWFAFAGLFWVFAFAPGTSADGQRFTSEDVSSYSWFVVLFAVLAVSAADRWMVPRSPLRRASGATRRPQDPSPE